MFARIDRWVIEQGFEPLAHWIERNFGFTNFTVAKFMVVVWATGALAQAYHTGAVFWWSMATIISLLAPVAIYILSDEERKVKPGLANAEKLNTISMFFRWVISGQAILTALIAIHVASFTPADFSFFGYWLYLYFRACDTPKPWVENAVAYAGNA